MVLLIPSYEPDARLIDVVLRLRAVLPDAIVVVDDGSGPAYRDVFAVVRELGATVLTSAVNGGKGSALKTGFRYIRDHHPGEGVVCVDGDGQHAAADVVRVAQRVASASDAMVLGVRRFTGVVPLRSRLGNTVARRTFSLATGFDITDTQTGLRGYPAGMLDWLLTVKGDRFDYELATLLSARTDGHRIEEVPIDTIYLDQNESSHFRPVIDSLRVARPFLAFAGSSIVSFAIDAVLVLVLAWLTGSLLVAAVGARVVSGTVNFLLNRHVVFRERSRTLRRSAALYAGLAAAVLAAGWAGLEVLTSLGLPLLAAKLVTDVILYIVTFVVQRRVVFRGRAGSSSGGSSVPHAGSGPEQPALPGPAVQPVLESNVRPVGGRLPELDLIGGHGPGAPGARDPGRVSVDDPGRLRVRLPVGVNGCEGFALVSDEGGRA